MAVVNRQSCRAVGRVAVFICIEYYIVQKRYPVDTHELWCQRYFKFQLINWPWKRLIEYYGVEAILLPSNNQSITARNHRCKVFPSRHSGDSAINQQLIRNQSFRIINSNTINSQRHSEYIVVTQDKILGFRHHLYP
ncbi:hypothetical protein CS078_07790 [Pseudomonas prosekii]|uniref:Uncharacterized protein n=1 Tax=Pseudomonas prosekii TaxID=1148509 RepID=A0A3L8CU01_9PSED|nr:hypothetical protein CS078_07790 [Pseudomonas prosekii]